MASASSSPIVFFVSGFGKFRGVERNPSSLIVPRLEEHFALNCPARKIPWSLVRFEETKIFEVSGGGVDEEIARLRTKLEALPRGATVVLLHFGVAAGAPGFSLEQVGYNDASFRVPDERGVNSMREKIDKEEDLGTRHFTSLPVPSLVSCLVSQHDQPVALSTDPGRFICNYLYYRSLCLCEDLNDRSDHQAAPGGSSSNTSASASARRPGPRFSSLFCHIPALETIGLDDQLHFAGLLVSALAEAVFLGTTSYMDKYRPLPSQASSSGGGGNNTGRVSGRDDGKSGGVALPSEALLASAAAQTLLASGAAGAGSAGIAAFERRFADVQTASAGATSSSSSYSSSAFSLPSHDDGPRGGALASRNQEDGDEEDGEEEEGLYGPPESSASSLGLPLQISFSSTPASLSSAAALAELQSLGFEKALCERGLKAVAVVGSVSSATSNGKAVPTSTRALVERAAEWILSHLEDGDGGATASASASSAPPVAAPTVVLPSDPVPVSAPSSSSFSSSLLSSSSFVVAGHRQSMSGFGADAPAVYFTSQSATSFAGAALVTAAPSSSSSSSTASADDDSARRPPSSSDAGSETGTAGGTAGSGSNNNTPAPTPPLHLPFALPPRSASSSASFPPDSAADGRGSSHHPSLREVSTGAGFSVSVATAASLSLPVAPPATVATTSGEGPSPADMAAAMAAFFSGNNSSSSATPGNSTTASGGGGSSGGGGGVGPQSQYKMTIVVRMDLSMTAGKIAAQACHAALKAVAKTDRAVVRNWQSSGEAIVLLKGESMDQLNQLHETARALGIPATFIRDAGRTQVDPGTTTVLAVGPGLRGEVDAITGSLKLL